MARLGCSETDGHYYIRAGQAKGTWQVKPEGIHWLRQQGRHLPKRGQRIALDFYDFCRLRDEGLVHTLGIDYEKKPEAYGFSSLDREIARYGPPLLLRLYDRLNFRGDAARSWALLIKLDELDEEALYDHQDAVAIGCWPSMTSLRWINDASLWPEVAPQIASYKMYWQNNKQGTFLLSEAAPTTGLRNDWQGNVFRAYELPPLTDTWRRCCPNERISFDDCQELYWLARTNNDPEWPGQTQPIGEPYQGWQLWHLQMTEETLWEDIERWLSYRGVKLSYPHWRLRLLSPLSYRVENKYICSPEQQLLIQCDAPTYASEHAQTPTFLSLAPVQNMSVRQPVLNPCYSTILLTDRTNYLLAPTLLPDLQYRIQASGKASGQRLALQTAPLSTRQPDWLQGLRCTLTTASKQFTFAAFSAEQQQSSHELQIGGDFTREELEHLAWDYQPAGLPCLLRWEALSPQGKRCPDKSHTFTTASALTNWWQNIIWQSAADSAWIKLTLDAASFGSISLTLDFRPKSSPVQTLQINQDWWTDACFTASFLWLSRLVGQETAQAQQIVSPVLSQLLRQLCVPDMPAPLRNALILLATRRSIPVWIYLRIQMLLTKLYANDGSNMVVEEGW